MCARFLYRLLYRMIKILRFKNRLHEIFSYFSFLDNIIELLDARVSFFFFVFRYKCFSLYFECLSSFITIVYLIFSFCITTEQKRNALWNGEFNIKCMYRIFVCGGNKNKKPKAFEMRNNNRTKQNISSIDLNALRHFAIPTLSDTLSCRFRWYSVRKYDAALMRWFNNNKHKRKANKKKEWSWSETKHKASTENKS